MKKVLLLLADGFEIYEASVFIDVIGWNLVEGDGSTRLYSCGLRKELRSTFDQRFTVDFVINEINVDDYAALAIPGGFEEFDFYRDAFDEKFLSLIQQFRDKNKIIASICVGALPLGKSGILRNRCATTYNKNPLRQQMLRSYEAQVMNEPVVEDDNIITSWNPSTAIPVAMRLLEKLTSKENAERVSTLMGF